MTTWKDEGKKLLDNVTTNAFKSVKAPFDVLVGTTSSTGQKTSGLLGSLAGLVNWGGKTSLRVTNNALGFVNGFAQSGLGKRVIALGIVATAVTMVVGWFTGNKKSKQAEQIAQAQARINNARAYQFENPDARGGHAAAYQRGQGQAAEYGR